jgi:transcriptional regulator with XRE-family HTH domain
MTNDDQEQARKDLGNKLRQSRESASLTQSEVATMAGVHVNFYARVERGEENPSFDKLRNIMKVLKIKSLDL